MNLRNTVLNERSKHKGNTCAIPSVGSSRLGKTNQWELLVPAEMSLVGPIWGDGNVLS